MDKYGVKQCPNTALLEVKADSFLVKTPEGNEEEMLFDYGFVCLGMRANAPILDAVRKEFEDEDVEIMNIGDSVRARTQCLLFDRKFLRNFLSKNALPTCRTFSFRSLFYRNVIQSSPDIFSAQSGSLLLD